MSVTALLVTAVVASRSQVVPVGPPFVLISPSGELHLSNGLVVDVSGRMGDFVAVWPSDNITAGD